MDTQKILIFLEQLRDYLIVSLKGFAAELLRPQIVGIMIAGIFLIILVIWLDSAIKAFRHDWQDFVKKTGFSPIKDPFKMIYEDLSNFELLEKGQALGSIKAFSGLWQGNTWVVFEYKTQAANFSRLACYVRLKDVNVPKFYVGVRHFHGFSKNFEGYKDISYSQDTPFFKTYSVKTLDPGGFLKMLTLEFVDFFSRKVNRKRVLEGEGDIMVLYNSERHHPATCQEKLDLLCEASGSVKMLLGV